MNYFDGLTEIEIYVILDVINKTPELFYDKYGMFH